MQDMIDNSLLYHAKYLGTNESGSCFVNRVFLASRLDPQDISSLLSLYTAGTITQETILKQLVEGEVLGDEFDVEEELQATEEGGLIATEPPEPEVEEEVEEDEEN